MEENLEEKNFTISNEDDHAVDFTHCDDMYPIHSNSLEFKNSEGKECFAMDCQNVEDKEILTGNALDDSRKELYTECRSPNSCITPMMNLPNYLLDV